MYIRKDNLHGVENVSGVEKVTDGCDFLEFFLDF
jgi:hypothetical protein